MTTEKAILGGGCSPRVLQDLIRKRPGVISTRVGYTGGDVPNGYGRARWSPEVTAAGPFWEADRGPGLPGRSSPTGTPATSSAPAGSSRTEQEHGRWPPRPDRGEPAAAFVADPPRGRLSLAADAGRHPVGGVICSAAGSACPNRGRRIRDLKSGPFLLSCRSSRDHLSEPFLLTPDGGCAPAVLVALRSGGTACPRLRLSLRKQGRRTLPT